MPTGRNNNLGKDVEMRIQASREHADLDLAVAFVDRQGSLLSSDAPSTAFQPVKDRIFWAAPFLPCLPVTGVWVGSPPSTLLSDSGKHGRFGLNCGNTAEGSLEIASAVPLPKDLLIAPIYVAGSGLAPES